MTGDSVNGEALLIVAGEASGDLHGARLLEELARLAPNLEPFGLGGDEMREAGLEALADSAEISVVGLSEALKILPRAWQIYRQILAEVDRRRPRYAVLIDFPDFNLRLAKKLTRRGVKVIYYISPQIWAWRRSRVKTIARTVERMLVVFPFEVDFYRENGVDVTHVGHPLVDEVPQLPQIWDAAENAGEKRRFVVSLLPGSRRSEVGSLLPTMLESARLLAGELPLEIRLIQAPTVPPELFDEIIAAAGELDLVRVTRDRFTAIAGSHLAICASGTATVEVGLLGTPLIVIYRLTRFSYRLARFLVDLEHFSMVNLVLGGGVVPELLQDEAEPGRVAAEARRLLEDPERIAKLRASLAELRPRLGESGASGRAAAEIVRLMEETS